MLKDFLYNFSSRVGVTLIGLMRAFVVPRYLGPEFYGLLSLFGILRTFLGLLDIGISASYYYHIADIAAKNKSKSSIKSETSKYFSAKVLVNALGILFVIFAAFFIYPKHKEQSGIYIVGVCSIIVIHCLKQLHALSRKQAFLEKRFKFMAIIVLLETFIGALFAMAGAFFYSLIGVLIVQPVESLVGCIAYLKKTGGIPQIKINLKESLKIMKVSFNYFYGSFSFVILRMSDRILIAGLLNMESLGLYVLAHTISENIKNFVASIHEVLNPRITRQIAGAEKLGDLIGDIQKQTNLLFGIILYINGNALIFSSLIIYILPKFESSVEIFRILIISLTVALFNFVPVLIICSKRVGKAAVYSNFSIISSIINVGVSYTLIMFGYSIIGVAIGTLSSNIVLTFLCFAYMHYFVLNKELPFAYYLWLTGPLIILGILYVFKNEPVWIMFIFFHIIFLSLYHRNIREYINIALARSKTN